MPFTSKAQARAAFGGYLGAEMKKRAPEFAKATPSMSALPERVGKKKRMGRAIPDMRRFGKNV
jgi:hypothetical protein